MNLTVTDIRRLRPRDVRHLDRLNAPFTGVSTDSRTTAPGNLFIALKGESFDGHRFVAAAKERGAVAAMVEPDGVAVAPKDFPLIVVDNTLETMGKLARLYRRKFSIPVIAVAGSNGKTTAKEMIADVLRSTRSVLSTRGNLNNHIGVPLTLFGLNEEHDVAVVEVGTNHPGELAYLCRIVEPTHALVTSIGREHLEFFGDLKGVAREEGTVYRSLRGRRGAVAFVNGDDPLVAGLAARVRRKVTYGLSKKSFDIAGSGLQINAHGCATLRVGGKKAGRPFPLTLSVPGAHNALNALAAVAVGRTMGVAPRRIRSALEAFRPVGKRMEVLSLGGVTVFNDTYNANPDSTMAALETLSRTSVPGKKIAVLADMKELGAHAADEHRRVGEALNGLGIEYLLTYGDLAKEIHAGARVTFAVHYGQKNVLAEYLAELVSPGDAVLIKGSRGMTMEDVVVFLAQRMQPVPRES